MTNIPTDLLRTLVAVADLRSFTKAAISLGVTQPAVSAQIKRLQGLLGSDLFDRSVTGVAFTPQGEKIVAYARRLLSINDQIIEIGEENLNSDKTIRVGAPGDIVASVVSTIVARFRAQHPRVRFVVRLGAYEQFLNDLRQGDLDLIVGLSMTEPVDARHYWPEEMCWTRGERTKIDIEKPVPLVSYGEKSLNRSVAVAALVRAGLQYEDSFLCPSFLGLSGAVAAGLGVMPLVRRRVAAFGLLPWDDGPLPKLDDIYCGIYVRESAGEALPHELADAIASLLRPDSAMSTDLLDVFAPSYRLVKAAS
ncbi:MAG TPA: LysR family transcriptional regulator [Pseudolabrys sp.]|jgi:DNA-binding transcriptional LysR family regulator|nr:LysR family transcriptional regulator [Pseudolabrys sp.]